MTPRRILIVKLGAVGDVVHALYPLRALRRAFPDARIAWAVEDKSADVLAGQPDVDEVMVFPRRTAKGPWKALATFLTFARALRAFRPDVAIDLQTLFKSGLLTFLSGARTRIGFRKWREGNFLFTNVRVAARPEEKHAVEKYLALLRPLGIEPDRAIGAPTGADPVHLVASVEQGARVDAFLATLPAGPPVVAVNPGASWATKRWPASRYGEVARALADDPGATIVVLWGPGELAMAEAVRAAAGDRAFLAPETSLRELAHLLAHCALYVGGDTGPMHVAAAMGTAAVALFGPSDPARVGPWGVPSRIVEPLGFGCLHCWKRACRRRCLEAIDAPTVTRAARSLLAEVAR
jgi:lipopolysaccharide heptosyltransferase I